MVTNLGMAGDDDRDPYTVENLVMILSGVFAPPRMSAYKTD